MLPDPLESKEETGSNNSFELLDVSDVISLSESVGSDHSAETVIYRPSGSRRSSQSLSSGNSTNTVISVIPKPAGGSLGDFATLNPTIPSTILSLAQETSKDQPESEKQSERLEITILDLTEDLRAMPSGILKSRYPLLEIILPFVFPKTIVFKHLQNILSIEFPQILIEPNTHRFHSYDPWTRRVPLTDADEYFDYIETNELPDPKDPKRLEKNKTYIEYLLRLRDQKRKTVSYMANRVCRFVSRRSPSSDDSLMEEALKMQVEIETETKTAFDPDDYIKNQLPNDWVCYLHEKSDCKCYVYGCALLEHNRYKLRFYHINHTSLRLRQLSPLIEECRMLRAAIVLSLLQRHVLYIELFKVHSGDKDFIELLEMDKAIRIERAKFRFEQVSIKLEIVKKMLVEYTAYWRDRLLYL